MKNEITNLIKSLIPDIEDDYRATDDPDDNEPGMCVTIATNDDQSQWAFQTGDNSYSGGCYGMPHWAVVYLYRDSDPEEIADDVFDQWNELIESCKP